MGFGQLLSLLPIHAVPFLRRSVQLPPQRPPRHRLRQVQVAARRRLRFAQVLFIYFIVFYYTPLINLMKFLSYYFLCGTTLFSCGVGENINSYAMMNFRCAFVSNFYYVLCIHIKCCTYTSKMARFIYPNTYIRNLLSRK